MKLSHETRMQVTRLALAGAVADLAPGERWVPLAQKRILRGMYDDHCERILSDPMYVAEIESDGRMDA